MAPDLCLLGKRQIGLHASFEEWVHNLEPAKNNNGFMREYTMDCSQMVDIDCILMLDDHFFVQLMGLKIRDGVFLAL